MHVVAAAPDQLANGPHPYGKDALYSSPRRRPGTVVIECSHCHARTACRTPISGCASPRCRRGCRSSATSTGSAAPPAAPAAGAASAGPNNPSIAPRAPQLGHTRATVLCLVDQDEIGVHVGFRSQPYTLSTTECLPGTPTKGRCNVTRMRRAATTVAVLGSAAVLTLPAVNRFAAAEPPSPAAVTTTPIKHLVVIFQENVSFDHYFGTYPERDEHVRAAVRRRHTPKVNGLANTPGAGGTGTLLTTTRTSTPAATRSTRAGSIPANINDVLTCDQDHDYNDEQKAFDDGAMDKFVTTVGTATGTSGTGQRVPGQRRHELLRRQHRDRLWNYAQQFAMSDNSFGTDVRSVGAGCGQPRRRATPAASVSTINGAATDGDTVSDGQGGISLIEDAQPYYDDCSTRDAVSLTGQEHRRRAQRGRAELGLVPGRLPADDHVRHARRRASRRARSRPTSSRASSPSRRHPTRACATPCTRSARRSAAPAGHAGGTNYGNKDDYIAHHEPFQYYASTANPHHLAPASLAAIGTDTQTITAGVPQFDTANHQYDMSDFDSLVGAITPRLPVAGPPPGGELPQGARLPGRSRRLLRPARRAAVRRQGDQRARAARRTGRAPRWSSPTTTPTAGTTTSSAACTTRRTRRGRDPARSAGLPQRHRAVRQHARPTRRWPERTVVAATARACRCSSSRRGPSTNFVDHTLTDQSLDHEVRRGQLAAAGDRRLVRHDRRVARTTCSTSAGHHGATAKLFLGPGHRAALRQLIPRRLDGRSRGAPAVVRVLRHPPRAREWRWSSAYGSSRRSPATGRSLRPRAREGCRRDRRVEPSPRGGGRGPTGG